MQVDGTDPQLRDTRTGKGATCPTLLHYLAKVLLRTDPRLVLFHEDLPSLEAVARRK
jgi:diaphanous 1